MIHLFIVSLPLVNSICINICEHINCHAGQCSMTDDCKPRCTCDDNITGEFCEKVIDGCKTAVGHSKCNEPEGQCSHIENDPYGLFYECTCINKCFSGVHCDVEHDPCFNHECKGFFSRCVKSENCDDYTCDCEHHLEGDRCQFYKNACEFLPLVCGDGLCKSVQSVIDIDGVATPVSYECECSACWRHNGVGMPNCDQPFDICANVDCNGGTCVGSSDCTNFYCACPSCKTGIDCSISMPNPCDSTTFANSCMTSASDQSRRNIGKAWRNTLLAE